MYLALASCSFIEIKTFWVNSEASRAASWSSELLVGEVYINVFLLQQQDSCCFSASADVCKEIACKMQLPLLLWVCIWAASTTFGFSSTLVFNSITWKNIIVKSEGAPDTSRDNKLNLTNYFVRWKLAHGLCIFRDRLQLCLEVFNV